MHIFNNLMPVLTNVVMEVSDFNGLTNLLTAPLNDFKIFIQTIALLVAAAMAMFYKVREMFASAQEDQMYSQKTKKVLIALGFIFLTPSFINIIQNYLMK